MKEAESFHQSRDGEIQGTQAEDGEHVRGVRDKSVERDREDRRDGVNGEQQVCGFDYGQNN